MACSRRPRIFCNLVLSPRSCMDAQPISLITCMFNDIELIDDPRADNARHFLADILILAMLGVMGGLDDYPGIVEYGRDEQDWLKTFLRLPHGIPSVSTFRRVFACSSRPCC